MRKRRKGKKGKKSCRKRIKKAKRKGVQSIDFSAELNQTTWLFFSFVWFCFFDSFLLIFNPNLYIFNFASAISMTSSSPAVSSSLLMSVPQIRTCFSPRDDSFSRSRRRRLSLIRPTLLHAPPLPRFHLKSQSIFYPQRCLL